MPSQCCMLQCHIECRPARTGSCARRWLGRARRLAALLLGATAAQSTFAQTAYYRHVVFDNSAQQQLDWHSAAVATAPSTLEAIDGRLPVERANFRTPPNALRIAWQSLADGAWDAEIHLANFPNRDPQMRGSVLYFWIFSPDPIAAADLPQVMLSDARDSLQVATFPGSFTAAVPLATFVDGDLPARRWVQVSMPFRELRSASVYEFHPERLQKVVFLQGRADGNRHVLIVDDVRVDDAERADARSGEVQRGR